jgi:hypothetical protein
MIVNPYQTPEIVEPATKQKTPLLDHVRAARRKVAAPAKWFRFAGWLHLAAGGSAAGSAMVVAIIVIVQAATRGIDPTFLAWPRLLRMMLICVLYVAANVTIILVGLWSQRYSRQLRELSSTRGAYRACYVGFAMTPLCIYPLPLAIYTLLVLRRADIRAVLTENDAARTGADTYEPLSTPGH